MARRQGSVCNVLTSSNRYYKFHVVTVEEALALEKVRELNWDTDAAVLAHSQSDGRLYANGMNLALGGMLPIIAEKPIQICQMHYSKQDDNAISARM